MRRQYTFWPVTLIAVLGTLFTQAAAASLISLTADADAYGRGGVHADTTFGSDPLLDVKGQLSPDFYRKTWIRFDLSTVAGGITASSLDLVIGSAPSSYDPATDHTYSLFGLNDGHAGEGWSEAALTWNNAPGNDTGSGNGLTGSEVTALGDLTIPQDSPAGTVLNFSSTALLNFLLADSDGQVTLILVDVTTRVTGAQFASRENGTYAAPVLNVTTVPLPAAAWLFGSGLLGLIGFAGRKKKRLFA